MPRPLAEQRSNSGRREDQEAVGRSTARAFAAAVSALVISTLVVSRTSDGLDVDGTVAANSFTAGTIAVTDDDDGRSLFDLSAMVPGRPSQGCIEVSYDGTILPVDLSLDARGEGGLMPYLGITIETGSGAAFGSCDGFVPERTLYQGDLEVLIDGGRMPLTRVLNTGETMSFRVTFQTADRNEVLGQEATVDLLWEVTPS